MKRIWYKKKIQFKTLIKFSQNLIVCDLHDNKEVLRSLRDSYSYSNIFFIPIDVTKNESIEEAYKLAAKKVNKFDVVVNGCGLMNDSFIDLTIDINLVSS